MRERRGERVEACCLSHKLWREWGYGPERGEQIRVLPRGSVVGGWVWCREAPRGLLKVVGRGAPVPVGVPRRGVNRGREAVKRWCVRGPSRGWWLMFSVVRHSVGWCCCVLCVFHYIWPLRPSVVFCLSALASAVFSPLAFFSCHGLCF